MLSKANRFSFRLLLLSSTVLMLSLLSCSGPNALEETPVPSLSPHLVLTPYRTPISSPSPSALPTGPLSVIPITAAPTSTPFLHTIQRGDTLGGIALRYGVSTEDLLAANPEINAQFLRIGDPVVVPLAGELPEQLPTLTPIPFRADPPLCYPSGQGGLWCFMLVHNNQTEAVENISGWIGIYAQEGDSSVGQVALPPLNLLQPGQALPLMTHFEPPLPQAFNVQGDLISVLPVGSDDQRYLPAEVVDLEVRLAPAGEYAELLGRIHLPEDSPALRTLWLAAVSYSASGEVAGVRKWEVEQECIRLQEEGAESGETQEQAPFLDPACLLFEFRVYSLGPAIDRVDLLVEARP